MAYKVRRLTTKDLFTFANIVGDITKELREKMKDMSVEEDSQALGMLIIETALKKSEGDLLKFFGDLVGMTKEEFEKESFSAPFDVIEKVAEQEDLASFLGRAQVLMKKFSGN